MPQRFEAKISAIKLSHDLLILSIAQLNHKLYAKEQKDTLRGVDTSEQVVFASKEVKKTVEQKII